MKYSNKHIDWVVRDFNQKLENDLGDCDGWGCAKCVLSGHLRGCALSSNRATLLAHANKKLEKANSEWRLVFV